MSYYDICENWWGDCIVGGENALAEKVGMDAAELYEILLPGLVVRLDLCQVLLVPQHAEYVIASVIFVPV